jgi:hypothetical protein
MADQGVSESDLAIICAVVEGLGRRRAVFRVVEGKAGWKRTFACDGLLNWKSAEARQAGFFPMVTPEF